MKISRRLAASAWAQRLAVKATIAASYNIVIKTPVYTMRNPSTGSTVTLVGVSHSGQLEYYELIKARLAALAHAGATVHHEGVIPPTSEQLAGTSEEMRRLYERYGAVEDRPGTSTAPSPTTGLCSWHVIRPEPSWERHDITLLEVLEFYGLEHAESWIARRQGPPQTYADARIAWAVKLKELTRIPRLVRAGVPRSEWGDEQMLSLGIYREAVEMAAADRHLERHPEADLALLWGAAHMPGLREAFAERGYKNESEEWITAIKASALFDALAKL